MIEKKWTVSRFNEDGDKEYIVCSDYEDAKKEVAQEELRDAVRDPYCFYNNGYTTVEPPEKEDSVLDEKTKKKLEKTEQTMTVLTRIGDQMTDYYSLKQKLRETIDLVKNDEYLKSDTLGQHLDDMSKYISLVWKELMAIHDEVHTRMEGCIAECTTEEEKIKRVQISKYFIREEREKSYRVEFPAACLDQPERTFWISKAFTSDKGHDLEIRFYRDNKIKAWKYSYDELCPRPVSSKELTADEFALVCAFSNDFLRNVVTASEVLNHEKDLQKEKKTLKM
ncbi:MAG: hypothetical protein U0J83_00820 [Bulleidia sp.]|nr:hypothetical protein [Bulleidia sp.]